MTPSLWRPPSSNTMVVFWRLAQPCPQFRNLQPPAANADAKKSCMRTRVYQDKIAFACTQKIQAFADAWSHSLPGANIELSWFHRSHLVLVAAEGTLEDRLGPLFSMPPASRRGMDHAFPHLGQEICTRLCVGRLHLVRAHFRLS